ncbi:MAG: YihY/virulence factor BrkB family protein [Lentisphaerae bacterium]|nr:YihY/virulence factor BrkB family protein [Lentisphaerota bacterium]
MFKKELSRIFEVFLISGRRYVSAAHAQRAVLLTYYTLFSIVPLAALLFGIAKGFALEKHLQEAIESRTVNHRELLQYISQFAERTLAEASGGVVAGIGVIALLWTVFWLITNIERAFNSVWDLPSGRNWWRKLSNCLSLTLFTPFLLIITGTAGMMMRRWWGKLAETVPFLDSALLTRMLAYLTSVILICLLFAVIYRLVPNTRVYVKSAIFAGLVAGIAFVLLQDGFLLLQKKVFSYNRLYGGFAALPLFLVWMNWSWQIVLFGAEISFVSQNLDSGIFENGKEKELSMRLCREHQLAVLRRVFTHFVSGNGALSEKSLFAGLHLPETMLKQEVAELLDKKIICRTLNEQQELAFLPGVPPENFTVLDFLNAISGRGDSETPEFSRFDRAFAAMEDAIKRDNANTRIIDIDENK